MRETKKSFSVTEKETLLRVHAWGNCQINQKSKQHGTTTLFVENNSPNIFFPCEKCAVCTGEELYREEP